MHPPRLPDWVVYGAVVLALLIAALGRREDADAPAAPPPTVEAEGEGPPLGPATPLDPAVVVEVEGRPQPGVGTAFSVSDGGAWLTARHVVEGCTQLAVVTGNGQGVQARAFLDPRTDVAVLTTPGGAESLPLALEGRPRVGQRAFHLGYPQGRPGEATSRLLGRETLIVRGRGARQEPVLAWVETGRTDGLRGSLAGLSGAPAVDASGRVIGVTVAESPRRGRIYTAAPESVRESLQAARARTGPQDGGEAVTVENYGRVADALRRDLRVAPVVCLAT